jgi:ATP-dependent protease ClpP protease subunit
MTTADRLAALWDKAKKPAPESIVAKKGDAAELYFYGDISPLDISADAVRNALADLGNAKSLTVYLSSPGGSVFEAKAIHAQLSRVAEKMPVNIVVDGLAASAASFLMMAGTHIAVAPGSTIMIHDAMAMLPTGNAAGLREMADLLDKESDNIATIYAKRTKMSVEEARKLMRAETWFTAEEAVAAKFADSIVGEKPAPKKQTRNTNTTFIQAAVLTERELRTARAVAEAARHTLDAQRVSSTPASPEKK